MAIEFNVDSQVRPYANVGAFPATGAVKTIYIAEDTNKTYRWTGGAYVEISQSPTQTSDLTNDGENGVNPFITALDIPGSLPPSGTAEGDLTGAYPNPTVHRIHGIDMQNGTPSADDVWVYGGSPAKWQHQHLNASQVDNDSSVTGTTVKLALEHLDSTKVPTSRTLTINGTTQDLSADRTFTISTGITIGTTAITSGTVGRVLFEGTGNVVQESANLFWDNTNGRLGIGTSSPSAIIHSVGTVTASGLIARGNFLNNTLVASANSDVLVGLDITPTFTNGAFSGVLNYAIRASSPVLFSGSVILGTTDYTPNDSFNPFAYTVKSRTGIYVANPTTNYGMIYGWNSLYANLGYGGGNPTLTASNAAWTSNLRLTAPSLRGTDGIFTSGINKFVAAEGGTDLNLIFAGSPTSSLVQGRVVAYGETHNPKRGALEIYAGADATFSNISFFTSSTERLRMFNTGNILIQSGGTFTDAGFKVDINGTARVSGNTKIGNTVYNDANSQLIIGIDGNATRVAIANSGSYQDFIFVSTGIGSSDINSWSFGQRRDTYFGNTIGSFQIVGSYTNNSGAGSMVGGGFRVPLICNPNGDIIISGASNSINGNVSVGSSTITASALLSVTSTTKGFLPPRMTTTQKNAIATPTAGLVVYDSTLNKLCVRTASAWETITSL